MFTFCQASMLYSLTSSTASIGCRDSNPFAKTCSLVNTLYFFDLLLFSTHVQPTVHRYHYKVLPRLQHGSRIHYKKKTSMKPTPSCIFHVNLPAILTKHIKSIYHSNAVTLSISFFSFSFYMFYLYSLPCPSFSAICP